VNTCYFPGCSLTGTGREFDSSLREVVALVGEELKEIQDWSCCGASSAHVTSHLLSLALPARNLVLAEQQGFESIFAPCAACYNRLLGTGHELRENNKLKNRVEEILDTKFENNLKVVNIIEFFRNIGLDKLAQFKKVDLSGIKVACYYGCLLVRPQSLITSDDCEQPTSMEKLVIITGAEAVNWNYKTECCGAGHSIAHTEIVEKLSKNIIDDAVAHGAEAIIVACPMCHSNLDMRQRNIKRDYKGHKELPIFYLSEWLGLAFGIEYKKLGLNLHMVNTMPMIEKHIKQGAAV